MGSVETPAAVVDGGGDTEMEAKKPGEAEKAKAKKLYAGVQSLGYRRDHMEVVFHSSAVCFATVVGLHNL